MRTPKRLYAQERIIYHPELLTCPHCGDLLVMCNYLAWDKTVQTLDRVLSVASRPAAVPTRRVWARVCVCCPQRLSASPCLAPPMAMMCWCALAGGDRSTAPRIARFTPNWPPRFASRSPTWAICINRSICRCWPATSASTATTWRRLPSQGGLIIALDGLAPQGGEPQIWFIRELTSGCTLRSGWLAQQDQPTFEAFLKPLTHLEWPILAVLSDKQTGLVPAVATVLPQSRHQFCQAHYLRNLAEPLAEADAAFKMALRQTVRQQVGDVLRQDSRTEPGQAAS